MSLKTRRWLAGIAVWALFIFAVASGNHLIGDSVWFVAIGCFALFAVVKTLNDLARHLFGPRDKSEYVFTGAWPRWLCRFIGDVYDEVPPVPHERPRS
jgi:hypothetical protein